MQNKPPLLNGISALLGGYLPSIGREPDRRSTTDERALRLRAQQQQPHLGVVGDPGDLDASGWAVVLPDVDNDALREALAPLLAHRRAQAGRYYRELTWLPGETKAAFLRRHGAFPGPADPARLPYYLLLIGKPAALTYEFQYDLDIEYAVGRLHFDDLADYHRYASNVVATETGANPRNRRFALFGPEHDPATRFSARYLLRDLADRHAVPAEERFLAERATKQHLGELLGPDGPDLLFAASHGLDFHEDPQLLLTHQGALLCQDCPDPTLPGRISSEHFFAADDLRSDPQPGLIALTFACFGVGTPELDTFPDAITGQRARRAPHPLLSALPGRLLARGAQAVIGHVDRVFSTSFLGDHDPPTGWNTVFAESVRGLLAGLPVGAALESFGMRHAVTELEWLREEREARYGKVVDPFYLDSLRLISCDARTYLVLGDPAVRLRPQPPPAPADSPPSIQLPEADVRQVIAIPAAPSSPAQPTHGYIIGGLGTDRFPTCCCLHARRSGWYGSGVLVHPYVVLTAGHCIDGHDGDDLLDWVYLGGEDVDGEGERISVRTFRSAQAETGHDLGLVLLRDAAKTPPTRIAGASLVDSASVFTVVGFGGAADVPAGKKRWVYLNPEPPTGDAAPPPTPGNGLTLGTADHKGDASHGDSGGPAFLERAGADGSTELLVAALVSQWKDGPGDGTIFTRISAVLPWINKTLQSFGIQLPSPR